MFYTLQIHTFRQLIFTYSMSSPPSVKHSHCQAILIVQLSPQSNTFFSEFHCPDLLVLQTHEARCLAQCLSPCHKCRLPCFIPKRNFQYCTQPVAPFSQVSLPFPIRSEGSSQA